MPQRWHRQETKHQICGNIESCGSIEVFDNWKATSIANRVIPCGLDGNASKDDCEDGADPESYHDNRSTIDDSPQNAFRKYSDIGRHDRKLGESYRAGVCEVAPVQRFRDPADILWELSEMWAEIPYMLSEPETSANQTRC